MLRTEIDRTVAAPQPQPEEDFASLLEEYMDPASMLNAASEKGEHMRPQSLSYKDIIGNGISLAERGAYKESVEAFLGALDRGQDLSLGAKAHVYSNLHQSAIGVARQSKNPAEKIEWYEKSYTWADKAIDVKSELESPGGILFTAVESSKARLDHAELEDNPAKQKEILEKAYDDLRVVGRTLPPFYNRWMFPYHETSGRVARFLNSIASDVDERRDWSKKWYDHASAVYEIATGDSDPASAARRAVEVGQAATAVAENENDFDKKRKFYLTANKYFDEVDESYLFRRNSLTHLRTHIVVANRLANLSQSDEEEIYWVSKAMDIGKKKVGREGAHVSDLITYFRNEIGQAERMTLVDDKNRLTWAVRKVGFMEQLAEAYSRQTKNINAISVLYHATRVLQEFIDDPEYQGEKVNLLARQLEIFDKVLGFNTRLLETTQLDRERLINDRSRVYSTQVDILKKLVDTDVDPEGKSIWTEKLLDAIERGIEFEKDRNIKKVINLHGIKANLLEDLAETSEEKLDLLTGSYREFIKAGEAAHSIGELNRAGYSFLIASKVADKLREIDEVSETWDKKGLAVSLRSAGIFAENQNYRKTSDALEAAGIFAGRLIESAATREEKDGWVEKVEECEKMRQGFAAKHEAELALAESAT